MAQAHRDDNRVTGLIVVDSDGNETNIRLVADSVTSRLLVTSTITGNVSIAPLTTIYNGSKTVPTGTAEVLSTTLSISSITIKSLSTNTYPIYIGSSSITTDNGFELLAGESISLDIDNVTGVYCIASNASQVVRWVAI